MMNSITHNIAGIAITLLCAFLAGIIGLFTMASLTSLSAQPSTEFEQMRTNGTVHDTTLSATDAAATL